MNKTALAIELADDAETLVRLAEAGLAEARGPTQRDIAETMLNEALALQDEVLETVAPALEQREQELRRDVREAVRALLRKPGSDWVMRHRKYHTAAVKARLVGMMGQRRYAEWFPW